jgi:hypothetical protein
MGDSSHRLVNSPTPDGLLGTLRSLNQPLRRMSQREQGGVGERDVFRLHECRVEQITSWFRFG